MLFAAKWTYSFESPNYKLKYQSLLTETLNLAPCFRCFWCFQRNFLAMDSFVHFLNLFGYRYRLSIAYVSKQQKTNEFNKYKGWDIHSLSRKKRILRNVNVSLQQKKRKENNNQKGESSSTLPWMLALFLRVSWKKFYFQQLNVILSPTNKSSVFNFHRLTIKENRNTEKVSHSLGSMIADIYAISVKI